MYLLFQAETGTVPHLVKGVFSDFDDMIYYLEEMLSDTGHVNIHELRNGEWCLGHPKLDVHLHIMEIKHNSADI